ncbi:hypothetical protein IHE32_14565 (plasmid) [Mycetohabitans rhizoxinica]
MMICVVPAWSACDGYSQSRRRRQWTATSKLDEAMQLMWTLDLRPNRTPYVGDTTHDYNVARARLATRSRVDGSS